MSRWVVDNTDIRYSTLIFGGIFWFDRFSNLLVMEMLNFF